MYVKRLMIQTGFFLLTLFTLGFSYFVLFVESDLLTLKAEQRRAEIARVVRQSEHLESEVYMISREIEQLKRDSELSSLIARTILGVVLPSETIYQLSSDQNRRSP